MAIDAMVLMVFLEGRRSGKANPKQEGIREEKNDLGVSRHE